MIKYYKLVYDGQVIGVSTSMQFLRYQRKHKIMLCADIDEAQYIMGDSIDVPGLAELYHVNWMVPEDDLLKGKYKILDDLIEITKEEFDILYGDEQAIADASQAFIDENTPEEDTGSLDPVAQMTLEYVREKKLEIMKATCNAIIENGVDVVIDDVKHHFSLTTQDQLNLITLSAAVVSGKQTVPYHADGESCKYYSPEQFALICEKAQQFITYHATYYNSLKAYILACDDIYEIYGIEYGAVVPDVYKSDVLKEIENYG